MSMNSKHSKEAAPEQAFSDDKAPTALPTIKPATLANVTFERRTARQLQHWNLGLTSENEILDPQFVHLSKTGT